MGLETVELLIAIEDEFHIQIPDAEAEKLSVLGEVHAHILRALRARGESPDEKKIWARLSATVIKQLGVHPREVIPTADIVRDLGAD